MFSVKNQKQRLYTIWGSTYVYLYFLWKLLISSLLYPLSMLWEGQYFKNEVVGLQMRQDIMFWIKSQSSTVCGIQEEEGEEFTLNRVSLTFQYCPIYINISTPAALG